MTQAERARRFQALHASGTFLIPNPYDAGSARVLERLGFPALTTTSAGFAFTLGRRDGDVTRDEVLEHARLLADATELPVAADLENGYGDTPEDVAETIRLAAAAGLVGGSIEDYTGRENQPIYDLDHAVARVEAAVRAARALPFPFVLVARAENFLRGRLDLDDTLRRLQAFAEAGADVLYAPSLPDVDTVRRVCAAVAPKPVNALASGRFSVTGLAAAGVRRISVGSALSRAAFGGLIDAAREMLDRGTFTFMDRKPTYSELIRSMAEAPARRS